MDLDDEELKATRKVNGVDKTTIQDDINLLNKKIEYCDNSEECIKLERCDDCYIEYEEIQALKRVLVYIKKLEEENKKYIVKLTDEEYRNLVDIIRKEVKQEIKQEIKDKIKELANTKGDFATYIATSEKIKVLEELLEE